VIKLLNSIKELSVAMDLLNKISKISTTASKLQNCNADVDAGDGRVTLKALLYFPDNRHRHAAHRAGTLATRAGRRGFFVE
jgi:hypothetical protein